MHYERRKMELTLKEIETMLLHHKIDRGGYLQSVAEMLGISKEEVLETMRDQAARKVKPPRSQRIVSIMMRRYNVPRELIEALIDEYNNDW